MVLRLAAGLSKIISPVQQRAVRDTMPSRAQFLLAIDQGTTSTRAILFDADARPIASHQQELRQIYPANGWVEHDAEEIWQATRACCRAVLKDVGEVAAIGITNQRETSVVWDRAAAKP